MKRIAALAFVAGLTLGTPGAHAEALLCAPEGGSDVASYLAFVVDWNDYGAMAAPTIAELTGEPGALSFEVREPAPTPSQVAQLPEPAPPVVAPAPALRSVVQRPVPQVATISTPDPVVAPPAPVPSLRSLNIQQFWVIGSYR